MRTENDIINAHFVQVAKHSTPNNSPNSGQLKGAGRLPVLLWCLITYIGSEAVKVIFRKDFGKGGLRLDLIIISSLLFAGVSVYAFYQSLIINDSERQTGTSDSNFVTGILYAILCLYVLIVGISRYYKSRKSEDIPENYLGTSFLIGPFFKGTWRIEKIQFYAEPLLTLAIGISFCFVDLIAGIPLVFCGISTWVREAMLRFYLPNETNEPPKQPSFHSTQRHEAQ